MVFCCFDDLRGLREMQRNQPQIEEANHNGDATVVAVASLNHGTAVKRSGRRAGGVH